MIPRTSLPMARFGLTETQVARFFDAYGYQCQRCGKETEALAIDHILPQSKGGRDTLENFQPLCKSCNSSKRDKHIDYRRFKVASHQIIKDEDFLPKPPRVYPGRTPSNNPPKKQITFCLSDDAQWLLEELKRRTGLRTSGIIEICLREQARQQGITLRPNSPTPTATEPPAPAQTPQDGTE